MERLVVIGGDAAGMSAASQARRLRGPDELEIVALERGDWTSYSACGIPYFVGGLVEDIDSMISRHPEEFRSRQSIDVRMRTEATAIDLASREVALQGPDGTERLGFDHLVIATGARPLRPDVPGLDSGFVHRVATMDDALAMRDTVLREKPRRAVVLGGGYIGIEMAEMLLERGLEVTVVLKDPLPLALLDEDMGEKVCAAMSKAGVRVVTCAPVTGIEADREGRACRVLTEEAGYDADMVVLGLGVRPDADLGRAAGLVVGDSGGLLVDESQRCRTSTGSAEGVYAAGDCAETRHRLTGATMSVALGTHANRQGRVAGTVIGGGRARFPGVLGTAITKFGETEIALTGLSSDTAAALGYDAESTVMESTTRAGYYPGASPITTKLVYERGSGRLLGAQIVGGPGSGKRIDVLAMALWNGMAVADIAGVDLSYAPPLSPTMDPVSIAARKAARG